MLPRILLAACALGLAVPAAHATDLWQVWQLATQNDPAFRQAMANRNASQEAKPAAWANLFPSIDLTASRTWQNNSGDRLSFFGSNVVPVQSSSNDRNDQWGAQLTQTLFNWQQFQAIRGGDLTVAQAQADYETAMQNLMVTVAQAYFNVLNAQDLLNADLGNQKALNKQYQQTEQQYKVGLIAVTGVRQAEAAYDQARAQVIVDRQSLAQAREALRAITGEYLPDLKAPGRDLPLTPPQPEDVKSWVTKAFADNPTLASAQFAQKIADNQVSQQQGGYMPNLNLVLQHVRTSGTGRSSYNVQGNPPPINTPDSSHSSDNQIGLQLQWNIFNGGGTRAAVKQYQYQADAAMAAEIAQRRTVEQNVRNAYLAVLSGIAQVQATRQAVAASQISLKATEEGLKVGTQTTLDVLTSRSTLLTSQKSYYNARYTYLVSVLQLEQAAGTLTPDDVKRLNNWLQAPGSATAPGAMSASVPGTVPTPISATAGGLR